MSKRIIGPILAILAIATVAIFVFVYQSSLNQNSGKSQPSATPTIAPTYTPVPTLISTITPTFTPIPTVIHSITPTTNPYSQWVDFNNTLLNGYQSNHLQIKGKMPNGSTITNGSGSDPADFTMQGSNFKMKFIIFAGDETFTYASVKKVGTFSGLGTVWRVRSGNTNVTSYTNQTIKTSGVCSITGEELKAPCGVLAFNAPSNKGSLWIQCEAVLDIRDSVCDKVIQSLVITAK